MKKKIHIIAICLLCMFQFECNGQVNHSHNIIEHDSISVGVDKVEKNFAMEDTITKIVLIENDTNYAFNQYVFYSVEGKEIKRVLKKDFPQTNPIYHLDLPKNKNFFDKKLPYFKSRQIPINNTEKKQVDFSIIEKNIGRKIPNIEMVDYVDANPADDNFFCNKNHLIRIQNATLLTSEEIENTIEEDQPSILDCSTIEVYNDLGNLILSKTIDFGRIGSCIISDDGKHLIGVYSKSFNFWEGRLGADRYPVGCFILDIESGIGLKRIEDSSIQKELGYTIFSEPLKYGIFSDGYFQLCFSGKYSDELVKVYLSVPEKKLFATRYRGQNVVNWKRSSWVVESFSTFSSLKESLEDFDVYRW